MRKQWNRVIMIAAAVLALCGISGCGKNVSSDELAAYVTDISGIVIPDEAKIIALGEASHGNKEFQELKLDVFSHLVNTTDVRALAIEGDFAGCALANDYIVNDVGNAEDVVRVLGYQIYRTDEMLELIQWMHDYNLSVDSTEQVRLYGIDMQRDMQAIDRIKNLYAAGENENNKDYVKRLDAMYHDEEDAFNPADLPQMEKLIQEIINDLSNNADIYKDATDDNTYIYAVQAARCLQQNIVLNGATTDYSQLRDEYMMENLGWVLNVEENLYQKRLMLSGHNGHIAQIVNSSYTNLGSYLNEEFGDAYYAIGTDFYLTECSIAGEEGRANHEFCSDDPIAASLKDMDENVYYLDFAKAENSDSLSAVISNNMKTGSLGEAYSPIMDVMKSSYQINYVPKDLYDGMIFVYKATPIEVWD